MPDSAAPVMKEKEAKDEQRRIKRREEGKEKQRKGKEKEREERSGHESRREGIEPSQKRPARKTTTLLGLGENSHGVKEEYTSTKANRKR